MYAFAVITEDSKQTMCVNVGGLDSVEQLEGRFFFLKKDYFLKWFFFLVVKGSKKPHSGAM